jgi:uncharacterized protein (UPF0335 family)
LTCGLFPTDRGAEWRPAALKTPACPSQYGHSHAADHAGLDPPSRFGHRTASSPRFRVAASSNAVPETDMAEDITETSQTVAAGQLKAFIERIERLEEEKQTLADDIKEVYAEMKGTGFDTKAVRTIIRLRKKDANERQEEEAILDLYMAALGMT